jgi:hypothetical protein
VIGRFTIEAANGGAVWAFQESGKLVVVGPGDQVAQGRWFGVGDDEHDFDVTLDVPVTGQGLKGVGEVSTDGDRLALYARASEPSDPQNAMPWETESFLIGERLGMVSEPTPAPSAGPVDCGRPTWQLDGAVLWNRCASPSPVASQPSESPAP